MTGMIRGTKVTTTGRGVIRGVRRGMTRRVRRKGTQRVRRRVPGPRMCPGKRPPRRRGSLVWRLAKSTWCWNAQH